MTLVIIPARLNSKRLPGKALEMIGKYNLIQHCIMRAQEAGLKPYVATDSVLIASVVGCACDVIMTGECASGADRVAVAAEIIDPEGKEEFIINYQGDMPFIDPHHLRMFISFVQMSNADVCTAYHDMKVVNCTRKAWFIRNSFRVHIGLYGYKREALRKFAAAPQSEYEKQESLEQTRMPHKFTWDYFEFPTMPIEINTPQDLEEVRRCIQYL